jgi:hypothetical protein
MKPIAIVILWLALSIAASAAKSEEMGDAKDMLCANAPKGTVEVLPPIVANWAVVICTPTGQALGPVVKDTPVLWVIAKTGAPWILEAVPREFNRPASLSKYDLRFTDFAAVERKGQGVEQSLKMWDLAFAPTPRPRIDRVVQLDARSVWGGAIFNLFFYISQGKPAWLIACANQCKQSIALRVEERDRAKPPNSPGTSQRR